MEYIFVFLAALGVLACHGQSTDGCQVKGYNLEPLSKSYWAVDLEKALCPDKTGNCALIFAACYSNYICADGVFACIVQNGSTVALGGEPNPAEIKDGEGFRLTYNHNTIVNKTAVVNETIIEFTCDAENTVGGDLRSQWAGWFKPQEKKLTNNGYHVTIKNALGCKKREGLGPGSQFMIILLVLFLLYFGGGIVYNHVNGARGEELIPHLWFWKNLPSYIVDGCIFVVRVITCQARENYSQNPDYGSTSQAGVSPSGRTYETL